jgi:5-methylcytosine-specific restriction endonuclease McrA
LKGPDVEPGEMPEVPPLPDASSPEVQDLPISRQAKTIYRLLRDNQGKALTMLKIRDALMEEFGEQEQLDRRRRELNRYFVIQRSGSGRDTGYQLVSKKAVEESAVLGISERMRAQVLQFGRCAMCGRTVEEHGVVLQVDHKMPQAWGGTNHIENLQALCEECNRGKKDHFRTLDQYGPQIRGASQHEEPHRRLGELLKALHPGEVRSDILEMVAHQRQYQEDWHKRLRELRVLGWEYTTRREKDPQGRVRVYYRLTKWAPWPGSSIRAEVSRRERARRVRKP